MGNVNGWLMLLAFVLGLVLTFFLLIRRVKREVPEYAGLGGGAAVAGAAGAAKLAGGGAGPKAGTVVEDEPYGAGSIRVNATADAPDGRWTVKGNEDSMLYHTTESPSWKQTIAEVWFRSTEDAERAGFVRWDSRGDAEVDAPTVKTGGTAEGAAAAAAGGAAAAKFAGSGDVEKPYGDGSVRVAAGAAAPSGYAIKGNEDSMLYHTPDSPFYKRTIAEVWFFDEPTAQAAGFNRWDSGKSQRENK